MSENTPQGPSKRPSRSPIRQYFNRMPLSDVTHSVGNSYIPREPQSPTPTQPPTKRPKLSSKIIDENDIKTLDNKNSLKPPTLTPPIKRVSTEKSESVYKNTIWRTHRNRMGPFDILMRRELWGTANASTRFMIKDFVSTDNDVYHFYGETRHIAPFACSFSHGVGNIDGRFLAVADEEGVISLLDTRVDNRIEMGGYERSRVQFQAHENAVFEVQWNYDDTSLITASGDQSARLWDVETQKCKAVFEGHTCKIWVTASRDGHIHIWDERTNSSRIIETTKFYAPTNTINYAHTGFQGIKRTRLSDPTPIRNNATKPTSVTGVQFLKHNENLLASSGAADGIIKYWDMRYHGLAKFPVQTSTDCSPAKRPHGISCLTLDHSGRRLYANSTDNYIYVYNTADLGIPITRFHHPTYRCSSFYIRMGLSPDDRYLMSGSSDRGIHIWETDAPERPPIILQGHEHEVTSVAWCRSDFDIIASCSDDLTLRVWHRRGLGED
ncbi:10784_t:CDS:10 [Ambispora gerdemannii]|uniref:10784_t:CDS:1 n=1 Tax=Ambispora gerdemannii TaxID=144530 RepID=A0A9N8ZAU8_9GLOM|nr:10784_t:CDS:10 [Ambispora gerdemannii]